MNKIRFCINALFQQNHFMIYAALTCYAFLVDFYGPQTKKGKPLNKRVYESKITKYIDESERQREREKEKEGENCRASPSELRMF